MTIEQVRAVHRGDEVLWTDPDGGTCSKVVTASTCELHGDVVKLIGIDGSYLECFMDELS
jgi:hypothetical protein